MSDRQKSAKLPFKRRRLRALSDEALAKADGGTMNQTKDYDRATLGFSTLHGGGYANHNQGLRR